MSGLLELAERVEKATGLDRQLMCQAFKAVFPEVSCGTLDAIDAWDERYDRFCAMLDVGASLDAAMMLAPPDWHVALIGVNQSWHVRLTHTVFQSQGETTGFAVSAPLALCAAVLRATHSERTER